MASSSPHDWNGFYVSSHFGYAAGSARTSGTETATGVGTLSGSLSYFDAYNPFTGTGSYFLGLGGGYNHVSPSGLVLGIEADVSFPSRIRGTQSVFTATGQAAYSEAQQFSGTLRGRLGYASGPWMLYATAGLAWTFNEFTRTQLLGTSPNGLVGPEDEESRFLVPRVGLAVGAGAEWALSPDWSARAEYLYTGFGTRNVHFPLAAQSFASDFHIHSLRVGLNYRLGANGIDPEIFTKGIRPLETDWFNLRGQSTFVQQYAFPFRAPYRGQNSLDPNHGRQTWDVTFYAGFKLWEGAEFWVDPEIDQGFGLSSTVGLAGYPSGEAYKVGSSVPYARIPRMFLRQTINLGGESQKVEAGINQFAATQTENRVVITVGKFGVTDIFDNNKYAHDPRSDFMNWSLIDTGTFDYAADAWGFTYGAAVEWYHGPWTVRGGIFDLSKVPNSSELDRRFEQFQWVGEIEHRHTLAGRPGKVAVTGFWSRGRMGRFDDAVKLAQLNGLPADIAAVRRYTSRHGISVNIEQELTSDLGLFARAGVASGEVEPYEFTDIDRTVAAGIAVSGKRWGRPDDMFGLAAVVNGISGQHQAYLNAGGIGILVGDGRLPNPGSEKILEAYYSFPVLSWKATIDYQFVSNPAYNKDRGPVSIIGTRIRAQF